MLQAVECAKVQSFIGTMQKRSPNMPHCNWTGTLRPHLVGPTRKASRGLSCIQDNTSSLHATKTHTVTELACMLPCHKTFAICLCICNWLHMESWVALQVLSYAACRLLPDCRCQTTFLVLTTQSQAFQRQRLSPDNSKQVFAPGMHVKCCTNKHHLCKLSADRHHGCHTENGHVHVCLHCCLL